MSVTEHSDDDSYCDPSDLMWEPPCSLRLSYWKRSPEVQNAKDNHVDYLETLPFSREELILKTTLANTDIAVEKNMFPYDTPKNIEHWTLWSREELSHRQICRFIEDWCENNPVAKDIVEWNYEENAHRSFDVPHVHVFFRFRSESSQKEEVCSPRLSLSHSSKRSFSNFSSSSSSSSSSDSGNTTRFSDSEPSDSESSSPVQHKKVCPSSRAEFTHTNVSCNIESDYEEGETDGEDFSDNEISITRSKLTRKVLNSLGTSRPLSLMQPAQDIADGLTDTEDE